MHDLTVLIKNELKSGFSQFDEHCVSLDVCVHHNTCVGVMWLISSAASCFSRVVLPALSNPNSSKRTSCSGDCFSLRRIDSRPYRGIMLHIRDG